MRAPQLAAALVSAVLCASSASNASAAPPAVGGLVQLPGTAHCYLTPDDVVTCTPWPGLQHVVSIAITPDGRYAYVASGGTTLSAIGAILRASRNPSTGALTPVAGTGGCYSNDGSSALGAGSCTVAVDAGASNGVNNGFELHGLVISADGRFLYAVSPVLNAIVSFAIDPSTGALTQLPLGQGGCVIDAGVGGCASATALSTPESLTLSPDGRTLYVVSYGSSSISVFTRDPTSGALSQLPGTAGCVSETGSGGSCGTDAALSEPGPAVVSPDGTRVNVATYGSDALLSYTVAADGHLFRAAGGAGCIQDVAGIADCPALPPLSGAYGLAASPDGRELYVGLYRDGGIAAFTAPTGAEPSLIGCTLEPPLALASCASGAGLYAMNEVAAAPDGAAVYGAAGEGAVSSASAVVAFARNGAGGALTQFTGAAGCQISNPPTTGAEAPCGSDRVVAGPYSIAVSPDSNFVYAGGFGWLTAYYAVAPPTCVNASASVTVGSSVALPLSCTDLDGNPITLAITARPTGGTLGAIDQQHQSVSYTATKTGTDHVMFAASDGTNSSAPASIQIAVTAKPPPAAPRITSFVESATRWRERRALPASASRAHRLPIGTTFRFKLSERARVKLTFTRRRHKRSAGTISFSARGGSSKRHFAGRLRRTRRLAKGAYTVTIIATNAAGRNSKPRSLKFTIV